MKATVRYLAVTATVLVFIFGASAAEDKSQQPAIVVRGLTGEVRDINVAIAAAEEVAPITGERPVADLNLSRMARWTRAWRDFARRMASESMRYVADVIGRSRT